MRLLMVSPTMCLVLVLVLCEYEEFHNIYCANGTSCFVYKIISFALRLMRFRTSNPNNIVYMIIVKEHFI